MSKPSEPGTREWVVREVREDDVPRIIELFRSNWGDDYPYPQYYEPEWVRRSIYADTVLWMVLEDAGHVVGSAALVMEAGDADDQMGEIGRLVVDPAHHGSGAATALIEALLALAADTVEFAFGEARTAHPISQHLLEVSGFAPAGFIEGGRVVGENRESLVIYAKWYGNAAALRRTTLPRLAPSVAPLASRVLPAIGVPAEFETVYTIPYIPEDNGDLEEVDRPALVRLAEIAALGGEPLVFGSVSLQNGLPRLRKRSVRYLGSRDPAGHPTGALGIHWDDANRVLKAVELLGADDGVRGWLCAALAGPLAESHGADLVEATVSAYDARIQETLVGLGFVAAAYLPAAAFCSGKRLDLVRMIKKTGGFKPAPVRLTDTAATIAALCVAKT